MVKLTTYSGINFGSSVVIRRSCWNVWVESINNEAKLVASLPPSLVCGGEGANRKPQSDNRKPCEFVLMAKEDFLLESVK